MNNTKSIVHPETQLRIQDNIAAIKAFKQGNNALLEQYTGWGGLRDAIFNRDIFCQLKFDCGLSDDEIASIKLTTSSGYFTPVNIIKQMWALCEETLPEPPQRILDAACGTGHFFAHMPDSWRKRSELQGVELDSLSVAMAQARVPEAHIQCMGFERYRATKPAILTIGNPPYGKAAIVDNEQPELAQYCIHHAFALKSFRALAVGGYLCLLLPAWFLDNGKKHVRELIAAEGGELISAVRFPDNLFQNAKVTVDCVLIKKCEVGKNKRVSHVLGGN